MGAKAGWGSAGSLLEKLASDLEFDGNQHTVQKTQLKFFFLFFFINKAKLVVFLFVFLQ